MKAPLQSYFFLILKERLEKCTGIHACIFIIQMA